MDNLTEKPSVAIYARVSSEEQRQGQTIDSQVAELERFVSENSWQLFGIYKDEGWSGGLLERPALDRLRDDASAGKFNRVLINDVDRLGRDVTHLGIVKRDLERVGVEVVFRKLPAEKSPTYNLMVNILGSFAEFEREMITDRTRRGRRHKVEARQQFLGSKPPYGYRYIRKDYAAGKEGYLEINPEEAAVVREIYRWVDKEGLSARKVVDRLNTTTISPRKGGQWAKSTTIRILRSEVYAGVWHYNKHYSCEPTRRLSSRKYRRPKSSNRLRSRSDWLPVILPAHLRVISQDEWERVQKRLSDNIALSPRNSKHLYVLKGLVRCGGCGALYGGDPCHGKFYYRCHNRCKKVPTIREEVLEETVWGAIEGAVLNPSIILDQMVRRHKREETDAQHVAGELRELKRAQEQISHEESRILEAYRTSVISRLQLGGELEKLQSRKNLLAARRRNLENGHAISDADVRRSVTDYCNQAAGRLKSFTKEQRQRFLRLLITSISFDGKRVRIRGVIPVDAPRRRLDPQPSGDIQEASPAANYLGENRYRAVTTAFYYGGPNPNDGPKVEFDLIKPIIHIPRPVQQRDGLGRFLSMAHRTETLAA